MSTTIGGIGTVPTNPYEHTTDNLKEQYDNYMKIINGILSKDNLTTEDYNRLLAATRGLAELARNGDKDSNNRQMYMTNEMLGAINMLFNMLSMAGMDPLTGAKNPNEALTFLTSFIKHGIPIAGQEQPLKMVDILSILTKASIAANRGLEGMIQVDFLSEKFKNYAAMLTQLKAKVDNLNDMMKIFTTLQLISGQITIPPGTPFTFPPSSDADIPPAAIDDLVKFLNENFGRVEPPKTISVDDYNKLTPEEKKFAKPVLSFPTGQQVRDLTKEQLEALGFKFNGLHGRWEKVSGYTYTQPAGDAFRDAFNLGNGSASKMLIDFANMNEGRFYAQIASKIAAHFKIVVPIADATSDTGKELLNAHKDLKDLLNLLDPTGKERDIVGTNAYYVNQVIKDIEKHFKENGIDPNMVPPSNPGGQMPSLEALEKAAKQWILDGQDKGPTNAGQMRNNLKKAADAIGSLHESTSDQMSEDYTDLQNCIKIISMLLQALTTLNTTFAKRSSGS